MNPAQANAIQQGLNLHKQGKFREAEEIYQRVLNGATDDPGLIFLLSDLYLRRDWNGLAVHLLSNLLRQHPDNSEAWCNLGVAYRKENQNEIAQAAWERALKISGDSTEVCNNMAGLYSDTAEPTKALEWCERSLKVDPTNVAALWNKSLALLTLGRFEEGWKLYAWREKKEGWHSRDSVIAPWWDGKPVNSLYIHGEQGVGDEIMFSSAIPHVLGLAKNVTLEVNSRLRG